MALIHCSECGNKVSDKAKVCPNCGNPISSDKTVKIAFPKYQQQLFNTGCDVYDEDGNTIAKCKQGEIAEFECDEPMKVSVKMHGCFGNPSIEVEPGGRYKVNIRALGGIGISKVDIL